ncbi:hypothetical protein [Pseudomonas juntendi]|uniref:hypothetical protein n=1 Tax=Pseudomonas juntendi TaxID=2666183 RepID=UPI003B93EEAE
MNQYTGNERGPAARALSLLVLAIGVVFAIWSLYAYFADDVEHPGNVVVAFFGSTLRPFLKCSELSFFALQASLISVLSAVGTYAVIFGLACVLSRELRDLIQAGGYKALKAVRAEIAAKAERDAAESFCAPVAMPPLTKEQWYEALQALQREMVRTHDSLHGPINQHPAVRERAEHSVSVMVDVCSIIVRELPEFESCLTDSYRSAREKSKQYGRR